MQHLATDEAAVHVHAAMQEAEFAKISKGQMKGCWACSCCPLSTAMRTCLATLHSSADATPSNISTITFFS